MNKPSCAISSGVVIKKRYIILISIIVVAVMMIILSSCVHTDEPVPTERKAKKIYRLVAVKKDSTRVIIGTFK